MFYSSISLSSPVCLISTVSHSSSTPASHPVSPPPSALTTLPVSRNEEPGWWIPALGDTELPVGVGGSGGDSTEEVRERED